MPNTGEANSNAHDASIGGGTPAPAAGDDVTEAVAEEKLAQAEQHLADAKDAKAHWTKALAKLRKS